MLPGVAPQSDITLHAAVGVGYTTDANGISLGGDVSALLDPSITLDPAFFTANHLNFGDYSINVTSQQAVGGVPEPVSWTMMMIGFGILGVALRHQQFGSQLDS